MNRKRSALALALCLALWIASLTCALAEGDAEPATRRLRLGSSIYVIDIDDSYTYGWLTESDMAEHQVAYLYSNDRLLDFDIYQFPKEDEAEDLATFVTEAVAALPTVSEVVTEATVNDIQTAWYRAAEEYDGERYETLTYVLDDINSFIEVVFWLDGDDAESDAAAIIDSLSFVEVQQIRLGTSPFSVVALSNFKEGELTEADIDQGQVAYYRSDETLLDFDVYQFSKAGLPDNLATYAVQDASAYENITEMVTNGTVNGIPVAWYRTTDVHEGVEYETFTCILDDADEYVKIVFWLDGQTAESEAAAIVQSLWNAEEDAGAEGALDADYALELGTSAYTVVVPGSFVKGAVTALDDEEGQVGYYFSPDTLMDFDIYQFSKEGFSETAAGYAAEEAATRETVTELVTDREINGIPVVWYRAVQEHEGTGYDTVTYVLDDDDEYVKIVFWLDGDTAEAEMDAIMQTLSISGEITDGES